MTAPAVEPTEAPDPREVEVLMKHREQRDAYSIRTIGCSCGWCPSGHAGAPSFLRQFAKHVVEKLAGAAV